MAGEEREKRVKDLFEALPDTRPGSCPYHPQIGWFVRVPGTNAYVCPQENHGDVGPGIVDNIPWKTRGNG